MWRLYTAADGDWWVVFKNQAGETWVHAAGFEGHFCWPEEPFLSGVLWDRTLFTWEKL